MAGSVLVAYATRSGSAREIAEALAVTLCEQHLEVDIQPMKAVSSFAGYRAVVLGVPLFKFRWHKDTRRFLRGTDKPCKSAQWQFSRLAHFTMLKRNGRGCAVSSRRRL